MRGSAERPIRELYQLATLYGVQTAYRDASGKRQQASPESLLAVLQMLGAPLATLLGVPDALRVRRQTLWQQGLEPVIIIWQHHTTALQIRLPVAQSSGPLGCDITLETGETYHWDDLLERLAIVQTVTVEGVPYHRLRLPLPRTLPIGYHHVTLQTAQRQWEGVLICAPQRAYSPSDATAHKDWGMFVPLYALHSHRSWGCGDFTDLATLASWTAACGGSVVATLPLLSAFLDTPYEPSPYAPASRLFWNELYIDVTRAPGLDTCQTAQELLANAGLQETLASCRHARRVDYRTIMQLKRQLLEPLAQHFFSTAAEHHPAFQAYLDSHPAVQDYARFRAVGERLQTPWPTWPESLRLGWIRSTDYDEQAWRYHVYVQWVAHEQMTQVSRQSREVGVHLYLDLPLGVHAHSYDVWREREFFALEADGGAPPDVVFTKGQNWGFPPLHPEVMRQQGYRYVLAYLRHQLKHTGLLRIDHVMGLHRLYWVPKGMEPTQGVYVRYPAEELYALLNVESHRHQVVLIGENLGTVPAYVNATMARHRLQRMYVVQYALTAEVESALPKVFQHTVASMNTHDMPPFAAYAQGLDIDDRQQQALLSAPEAAEEHQQRRAYLTALRSFLAQQGFLTASKADPRAVLDACLAFVSASPAALVLLNLEDLWLETQPQNFPGTHTERPNWQSKTRYSLEEIQQLPEVLATLDKVCQLRAQRRRAS